MFTSVATRVMAGRIAIQTFNWRPTKSLDVVKFIKSKRTYMFDRKLKSMRIAEENTNKLKF